MQKRFGVLVLIGLWTVGMTTLAWAQKPDAKPADKVNVSGTWNISVETPQGSGSPKVTLAQEVEKLTGTYKGMFGESKVTGTIKGDKIQFSVPVNAQGTDLIITYSGQVEKDSIKGTAQFGDFGSGTWTASRAKSEEPKKDEPKKKE